MKKYIFLFFIAALISCKKDPIKDPAPVVQQTGFIAGQGVFVLDEGNFMFGNAAVSYYNFSNGAVTVDVFKPANNRPLGDVCQSMAVINGKGYVVVNNSGKIEIVNMTDFKSIGTITGFNSPRYILQTAPDKAYVTDLYSNSISIVNLSTGMVTAKISCLGWTEQLVKAGNNVFVTNPDKGKVYVINSLTDVIIDSITVTKGAGSAVIDNAGKLWVMCSGSSSSSINGALYKINTAADSIENTFAFTASDSPGRLTKNGAGDTLFYLNKGINKIAASSSLLPSAIFIPEGSRNFYGLGIDPLSSKIYAADAVDYVQSGRIYVYDASGTQTASFLAGIIPGDFLFY